MHIEVMRYCVRAWLSDVRQRTLLIEDVSERIRRIESALTLRGVRFDKEGSAPSVDAAMEEGIAKLQELRAEWIDRVEECTEYFREAYNLCCPENLNRWAVWLHDYEGLSWGKVAKKIGYSAPQTRRISALGYAEVYREMPGEWREIIPKAL